MKTNNPYPSLLNPYSLTLLIIMLGLTGSGAFLLYKVNIWGLIPFIMGVLMVQGFKMPKDDMPQKVWLITFLGQPTTVMVDKLTLLLDWIPNMKFVGYMEFKLEQVDEDIKLTKPILCSDGQYVTGVASVSVLPDSIDDEEDFSDNPLKRPLTGGEKLRNFSNVTKGDMKKAFAQADDIITAHVQVSAIDKTAEKMERNALKYSDSILNQITGAVGVPNDGGINSTLDDTRGLGIRFAKFQLNLVASDEVIKSRNDKQVQLSQREVLLVGTETMNRQIAERMKMYREGRVKVIRDNVGNIIDTIVEVPPTPVNKIPSIPEIRRDIMEENLFHTGDIQKILGNAIPVANIDPKSGKKGK